MPYENLATPRRARLALVALVATVPVGCSIRQVAVEGLADSLAASGDVYASDDDPELVREALPFALKTMEALAVESPRNRDLLLATCRGFAQYSAGFLVLDAAALEADDWEAAQRVRDRALRLSLRARDYGLRGLAVALPGVGEALRMHPDDALDGATADDVALLYWTGAAWGTAVSLAVDRPDVVADVDAVRALLHRALELDADWGAGALHDALIAVEALPEMMGGSERRALEHFERSVELSGGTRAGPYVTVAESVHVAHQDRRAFTGALERALAIDADARPSERLANLLAQRRARILLARADELFLEPLEPEPLDG